MRDASVKSTTASVASASDLHALLIHTEVQPVEALVAEDEPDADEDHRRGERSAIEPPRQHRVEQERGRDDHQTRTAHPSIMSRFDDDGLRATDPLDEDAAAPARSAAMIWSKTVADARGERDQVAEPVTQPLAAGGSPVYARDVDDVVRAFDTNAEIGTRERRRRPAARRRRPERDHRRGAAVVVGRRAAASSATR